MHETEKMPSSAFFPFREVRRNLPLRSPNVLDHRPLKMESSLAGLPKKDPFVVCHEVRENFVRIVLAGHHAYDSSSSSLCSVYGPSCCIFRSTSVMSSTSSQTSRLT